MLAVHPAIWMDFEMYENHYFIPPQDFLANNKRTLLNKRIQNIKERKEMNDSLIARNKEARLLKEKAEVCECECE